MNTPDGKALDLFAALKAQLGHESSLQADSLVTLMELETGHGFAPLGFDSLFSLCVQGLGMSEDAAGTRIYVARLARRVPLVIQWLREGRTNLTALRHLAKVLTPQNASTVLFEAQGLKIDEIKRLAFRMGNPGPAPGNPPKDGEESSGCRAVEGTPSEVKGRASEAKAGSSASNGAGGQSPAEVPDQSREQPYPPEPPPPVPNPRGRSSSQLKAVSETETRLSVVLPERVATKLKRIQDLASHKVRVDDLAALLEHVFDDYLASNDPLLEPVPEKPKPVKRVRRTRRIPKYVRAMVWQRDGGRCTFVSPLTGRRCECRRGLEIDHIQAYAKGGSSTDLANLRLLCRAHNAHAAREEFGAEFIAGKVRRPRAGPAASAQGPARTPARHSRTVTARA